MITTVITTYNDKEEKLYRSIYSVIRQILPANEIIIVDDGSLHPFCGLNTKLTNDRVIWIETPYNMGVAKARNLAVSMSHSEYICFLDSGDCWHKDKLKKQYWQMIIEDLDASYTGTFDVIADKYLSIHFPKKVTNYKKTLLLGNIGFVPSAMMIKRSVFNELGGFFETYDLPEDQDMGYRIAKHGYHIGLLKTPLTFWEVSYESRSSNPDKKRYTYLNFISVHEQDIIKENMLKECLRRYYKKIALKFFHHKQYLKAVKWSVYSLKKGYKPSTVLNIFIFSLFGILRLNPFWLTMTETIVSNTINKNKINLKGAESEFHELFLATKTGENKSGLVL